MNRERRKALQAIVDQLETLQMQLEEKLMGHSSIQVTTDIYTHLEQEDSLHVADKLNEYLSGKSENSAKSSQKVVKLAI